MSLKQWEQEQERLRSAKETEKGARKRAAWKHWKKVSKKGQKSQKSLTSYKRRRYQPVSGGLPGLGKRR